MATSWLISVGAAGLIGAIAWRGPMLLLGFSIAIPWIIFRQTTRLNATTVALVYFLAATVSIIAVSKVFEPSSSLQAWFIWVLASSILSLPWAILWSADPAQRIWRCPAALILSAVPPIGLVCWASPLVSAGILFPGTGLIGLAATALVPATLPVWPKSVVAVALAANLINGPIPSPAGIQALNTKDSPDFFQKEEEARIAIHSAQSRLLILPEGAVRRWTEATEAFWTPTMEHLEATHRTALVGAGLPIANSLEFRNGVVVIGASKQEPFSQRIPIPIGMWKPFGPADGVPLNLTGTGTLQIGPHNLAVLICYEQLLVWPILHSAFGKPTLIVGVSNAAWTRNTHIPAAQQFCLAAWSRLFGIPFLSAVNG
ncbi:MAG: hypothetical protein K2X03_23605 [Bryobacteraceae bacterium]|nr:hypothetical protein [Bryobacteraceae bacterium]